LFFYQSHSMWNLWQGSFHCERKFIIRSVLNAFASVMIVQQNRTINRQSTTQSVPTPLTKRVTSLVSGTYSFETRLICRLYYARILWDKCHNWNQLFHSSSSPRLRMISSGNQVRFILSISVFQAQLSLNNGSIHTYQADAYTNAPHEATVSRDISPHRRKEICILYSFSRLLLLHYISCSKSWSRPVQCLAVNKLW